MTSGSMFGTLAVMNHKLYGSRWHGVALGLLSTFAGLAAAEPGLFAAPRAPASDAFASREPAFSFPESGSEPHHSLPPLEPLTLAVEDDDDFDRRLIDMAQRLEQWIGEAMPSITMRDGLRDA